MLVLRMVGASPDGLGASCAMEATHGHAERGGIQACDASGLAAGMALAGPVGGYAG